jgi:adenine-specific DNA-methyltransferase
MPTLHWVGKEKVVNHHHDVPFRVLNKVSTFTAPEGLPENTTDNRIIHGDNLEALKSLLPEFEGQVKCIYIDPPYNTGNEGWVYNDAVNDPKMKRWLGQVVGKEGDDLSRHDKWLCMMYPRLKLLSRLLHPEGVLFVSIDDDEAHTLRLVLDEIFGRPARLATFVWRTDGNFDNQAKIKNCHEYIFMYSKAPEDFPYPPVVDPNTPADSKLFRPIIRNTIVKNGPKNPISDVVLPAGFPADFDSGEIDSRTDRWPHYLDNCRVEGGKLSANVTVRSGWSSLDLLQQFIGGGFKPLLDRKQQETVFKLMPSGAIECIKTRKPSHVVTVLSGQGSTQAASAELASTGVTFQYPKPSSLIRYLISLLDDDDFIVLDSFAGSGTTGHATLEQNRRDGGKRRFILVEMDDYALNTTAERVKRAITGGRETESSNAGLGGGFDFYTVGEPMFLPDENLNEAAGISAIRGYVAYSEGIPAADRTTAENPHSSYLLGLNRETAWVFHYEPDRATSLDMDFLGTLRFGGKTGAGKPGTVIIYADRCLLSKDFMTKHGIIFKKIPRDITRF